MPSIPGLPGQGHSAVVTAKIYINGTVLGTDVALVDLTVSSIFNKIASAKLRFQSGTTAISDRDNALSNDDRFKPGAELKVQLGYDGTGETVFEGIIIKHGIKYTLANGPELNIEAKDKAIKLTGARKSAYFIEKTDADIIQQLAGELSPEVDSTSYTHKQAVQFDVTDWDFLLMRAEAAGMLVHTDSNKLVVKKPVITEPVITATIGSNVRDFEADMDARKVVQSITSQSWDYSQQTLEASEAGAATLSEAGNISASELGSVIGAEPKMSHTGHLEQTQLQDWTDAADMRRLLAKIAGRLRMDGNSDLKPGVSMTLDGFGDRFNGDVFVTGVQHTYNGMWYSDVQFGLREDWFYKKEDVMDRPAKGLLAGVNGLQIGVVTDLDDPDGQYRVKVKIPVVGDEEAIWARVATLDAGDQHGSFFRPQVGDEAVLGFLNDDPREALILGYLHNKDMKASPLPVDSGALQYGFITKEGIKVILDDTNKAMKLIVTGSAGEKSIMMTSDSLELKDEHSNTIKMESSGITIQAGTGNVTIKGTQVLIN